MVKIGFMFGAGAEVGYGLPTGGDFALNIFRQDSSESKESFKSQRKSIDATSRYAQWLPNDYETKSISVFGKKAYEDIIRGTVEQNRDSIIERLNSLDSVASEIASALSEKGIDINADFNLRNGRPVSDSFMNKSINFVKEFEEGDNLFKSNYFSALLMAYKSMKKEKIHKSAELAKIILAVIQLQVGALGEKLSRKINDGIFNKKDDEIDILDDLGDIIQLNYQAVGMSGLEYLLEIQEPDCSTPDGQIVLFAQKLIEKIYSCVLDYKSLIDSNWMYLYHPKSEWAKFCKILIFLFNTQKYISDIYKGLPAGKTGYYDDIATAVEQGKLEITTVGTSNYTPLIEQKLSNTTITYLNGSTSLWYDPYLNKIGSYDELSTLNHFLVPLMFTQSGTKPMISIDMSSRYVSYYESLKQADAICVIGFGFNSDDEHINGLFRDLVDSQGKQIIVVSNNSSQSGTSFKNEIAQKLKLQNTDNISVIFVDENRNRNGVNWVDCLVASTNI